MTVKQGGSSALGESQMPVLRFQNMHNQLCESARTFRMVGPAWSLPLSHGDLLTLATSDH